MGSKDLSDHGRFGSKRFGESLQRLGAIAVLLLAAACQTTKEETPVTAPDPLAAAARDAVDALQSLARVEQTRTPPAQVDLAKIPEELKATVTFEWVGPASALLKKLAEQSGYSFSSAGRPPAAPLVVNVIAVDRPLYQVLTDIGLQMGTKANLAVSSKTRRFELRYAQP